MSRSRWFTGQSSAREACGKLANSLREHCNSGGGGRNRTGVHGFAGRCMTTLPPRPEGACREAMDAQTKGRAASRALPCEIWSGKGVSNSRPQPWQGCALPTELFPRNELRIIRSARLQPHPAENKGKCVAAFDSPHAGGSLLESARASTARRYTTIDQSVRSAATLMSTCPTAARSNRPKSRSS